MVKDVYEAEDEDTDHMYGERYEEHEEVSVVPPSDTVVNPGTVMVEYLDAVVTDAAVTTPRGPVELASDAPLHPHCDTVDLNIPENSCSPLPLVEVQRGSALIGRELHSIAGASNTMP